MNTSSPFTIPVIYTGKSLEMGTIFTFTGSCLVFLATVSMTMQCTALHGVPTMFISELDHPRFAEFDLSSLRTGIMAGAPCPTEIMQRVINEMHLNDILIGYGQTEVSPINNMTLPGDTHSLHQ